MHHLALSVEHSADVNIAKPTDVLVGKLLEVATLDVIKNRAVLTRLSILYF